MKALVFHGPGSKAWEEVPKPQIVDNTDAVVRVDCTTICGSDLHILKGDVPEVTTGRILGHEAVGTVESVGAAVTTVVPGDRVLVSCISACGRCRYCRESRYGQCLGGGGWILGHLIDGTQAEFVRVPFADTSTYKVPQGPSDEEVLMLADILPTAYEVGVLNGHVQPGDTVVVVGAGPIGLSAILGAQLYSPSRIIAIDLADARLEAAKLFGADLMVNNGREDPVAYVRDLTDGLRGRRGYRSSRCPGQLRVVHRAGAARWSRGQYRCPRQAGHASPRIPVDPRRHHHHRSGRHVFDADAAAPGRLPSDRCRAFCHPSFRAA